MRRPAGARLFTVLYLKNILSAFILPPLGPLMLVALGLLLLGRLPRTGRMLAWSGVALGVAMITPASVGTNRYGPAAAAPAGCAARAARPPVPPP